MYDNKYLTDTLFLLYDQLNDLEKWSVYNDDKYANEIADIRLTTEELRKKINE